MYLNCHSWYSFQYGLLSVERLASLAKQLHPHRITLTDINCMAGGPELALALESEGLCCNLGVEFRYAHQLFYILIARNLKGYAWINAHLTQWLRAIQIPGQSLPEPYFPEDVWVLYPPERMPSYSHPQEWMAIRPQDLSTRWSWQRRIAPQKWVACPTLTFENPADYPNHCTLRAIGENELIARLSPEQCDSPLHYFRSPSAIKDLYADIPWALDHAEQISQTCDFTPDFKRPKNLQHLYGSVARDLEVLQQLSEKGAIQKYGNPVPAAAAARIRKELEVIQELRFQTYYLVAEDMVQYATHRGFAHVGRGSGANSIVAYCLNITAVDPIQLDLYFERFLNATRSSPPDFDIDFSWKDRDDIFRYLFKKYNTTTLRASLLGTTVRYKSRAVIRELGKVLGLEKVEIDRLSHRLPQYYQHRSADLIHDPTLEKSLNPLHKRLLEMSGILHGMPSHLSIHAGGVLISEASLYSYSALFTPPKGFPVVQLDMFSAEDLQLHKLDVLSQRGLGHIEDTLQLITHRKGDEVGAKTRAYIQEVHQITNDPAACALLESGETLGCFYIESPAMRSLIRKLRCKDYLTLTAASSIIRPGVGHSGMMREFIARHRKEAPVVYLHPLMESLLGETYGIMIYQEDVLKIAHHFGGLSLAEADVLRRGMSGKLRSVTVIQTLKSTFFNECKKREISDAVIQEVWRQIESFSGYTFPKAHSASFAVESFQDLYLKYHYPLEFMTSVVNNFGGFYSTGFYLQEAKRLGARLALPCINHSEELATLEGDQVIRLGFRFAANLQQIHWEKIIENRKRYGVFSSLKDCMSRLKIPQEQLVHLIRMGAFDFTGKPRPRLLWEAFCYAPLSQSDPHQLFEPEIAEIPPLTIEDWPKTEYQYRELDYFGYPVTFDFFDLIPSIPPNRMSSQQMNTAPSTTVLMIGYLCARKPIQTRTGKLLQFLTFRDPEGVWDGVIFPGSGNNEPLRSQGPFACKGRIRKDFDVPTLEIQSYTLLEKHPTTTGALPTSSASPTKYS